MDLNQQKEQFSNAYLRAVAAVAGYGIYKPDPDEDSVDWGIAARGGRGSVRSPRLEVQLKCTAAEAPTGTAMSFALKRKNYNDLRDPDVLVPRILVVVRVPDEVRDWVTQSEQEMAVRHCGYWVSLRGRPDSPNEASVTIHVPRSQILTVVALNNLMAQIGEGKWP